MDVDFVKTSIGSYKTRLKDREDDAIAAIKDGSYWTAQIALSECAGFKAVIEELEFQLEVMEADRETMTSEQRGKPDGRGNRGVRGRSGSCGRG